MEYGLIGEKLTHSFSKIIHAEIENYEYELLEIAPCELEAFMKAKDFKAINVTIPYKQAVIPFLDEIEENALKIGAVNTVVNKNGKLYGYNTDFLGLKALINHTGVILKDKKVLVLGSGGTSKTASAVAESLGAKEIFVVSRSDGDGLISYKSALDNHTDADILINTTPCGMYPNIGYSAISLESFKNISGIIDVVYNPLASALITEAKQMGIKASGGLYMLVAQAVFAAEKFTGKVYDQTVTDKIYQKILKEKLNLVLVGMPASGKSTIGRRIALELKKDFFDSDDEIVKMAGMSIPEIFEAYGEAHFRELESVVIANLSLKQNVVIATGGGAILNSRNTDLLKENGFLVFIDRPIDELMTTPDRPLSSDREKLEQRFKERYDIYLKCSDYRLSCSSDLNENVSKLKEVFLNENSCN